MVEQLTIDDVVEFITGRIFLSVEVSYGPLHNSAHVISLDQITIQRIKQECLERFTAETCSLSFAGEEGSIVITEPDQYDIYFDKDSISIYKRL